MNDSGISRNRRYSPPLSSGRSGPVTKSGMPKITAQAVKCTSQALYFDCEAVILTNVRKKIYS